MSCQIRKMKMMAAAGCQERPTNAEAVKDFQIRFSQLQQERAKQDAMWEAPKSAHEIGVNNSTNTKELSYTSKYSLISKQGHVQDLS